MRKKRYPVNILRKIQREERHLPGKKKKPKNKRRKPKVDAEIREHEEFVLATELELKKILQANDVLSDIPFDCTPEELLGEIAIANDDATTVYVERDGLSTLTVILPQKKPTIANLKRAIESTARAQHKREQRDRYESRCRRRRHGIATEDEETGNVSENDNDSDNDDEIDSNETNADNNNKVLAAAPTAKLTNQKLQNQRRRRRQQQVGAREAWLAANRSTGEFIYSTTRCGHPHRTTVSWRFLWRAFMLIDVQTKQPLYDADGRKLLIDFGIENGTTLRFTKREIYMQRKRQK